ncbi:MAG: PKD domain-containing protein, partial [Candidatus Peribacteraceae bacterium]|nr:PKD domain-containing protein [Candidatus Peribacteraceae bacterium]
SECPCGMGFECKESGECIKSTKECTDGTWSGHCSFDKPFFCYEGILKPMCNECDCPDGFDCVEDENDIPKDLSGTMTIQYICVKSQLRCEDYTLNGVCSENTPYYCNEGNLIENCEQCGCDVGQCESDGGCFVNSAPVIEPIGNKEISEGDTLEFTLKATDPDNDNIRFHISNLPDGSEFDVYTGIFTWSPTYEQTGIYWVTFAVLDIREYPLSDHETVRITVGDVNRPPETKEINYISIDENVMLEIVIEATDPDSDTLTHSAENLPEGSSFDAENGRFTWIPDFGQEGNYKVIFTTSDGKLESSIEVVITVGDVNRPPKAVLSHPINGQKFISGRHVLFSAPDSYDPDEEQLEYSWDFGDGTTETSETDSTKHVYKNPGEYTIKLSVTDDDGLYNTKEIEIIVSEGIGEDSDSDGIDDSI